MSLDVTLIVETPITTVGTGVYVRRNGQNVELTPEEVRERYPDAEVEERETTTNEVFTANITHNLIKMAQAVGIYDALWRPYRLNENYSSELFDGDIVAEYEFEDNHPMYAISIVNTLAEGLTKLMADPEEYKKYNSPNGWGSYETLVNFTSSYLVACIQNPTAQIEVYR